jgi:fructose-specific phosphotransferase system IIA component
MILSEYLNKSNVIIDTTAKNRWDLIDEMIDIAVKSGDIAQENRETISKSLFEREKSMSTGIGNGVAIPHCNVTSVDDIIIVLATSSKGVDFDSIDGLPVKLAILLLVPKSKLSQHIKTLANIARLMSDDTLRKKLFTVKTAEELIKELKKLETPKKKK